MPIFKNLRRAIFGQSVDNSVLVDSTVIQAGGDVNIYGSDTAQTLASLSNKKLLNKVMAEKADHYFDMLLHLQIKDLKKELDVVFNYGIDNLEKEIAERLYFYRFCQGLKYEDTAQTSASKDFLEGEYAANAEWLTAVWKNPRKVDLSNFHAYMPETQVMAIEGIFKAQEYAIMIKLHSCLVNIELNPVVRKQLSLYNALSHFNTGRLTEARELFNKLDGKELNIRLFKLFTELQIANKYYVDERNDEELKRLLCDLEKLREEAKELFEANAQLVGILTFESYFNLGRCDSSYLQKAEEFYNALTLEQRRLEPIRYFYGLCLELAGKFDEAIAEYKGCDWQCDEVMASRLMVTYVQKQEYDEAIALYNQIVSKTPRVTSVYLLALYLKGDVSYKDKLEEASEQYSNSFEELFFIIHYVEDEQAFKMVILPVVKAMLDRGDSFNGLESAILTAYVFMFSRYNELDLLRIVLDSIRELDDLNNSVTHEVYKCLYGRVKKYNWDDSLGFHVPEEVKTVDIIAERFVGADIHKEWFLQIRLLTARAEGKKLSMLKFSRELYELSRDPVYAANILGIELEQGKSDLESFEKYLGVAKQFTNPHHLLTTALVYQRLGNRERADFFAYRALRILNGTDDYDVYGRFFLYASRYFGEEQIEVNKDRPTDKSIIYLETTDGRERKTVCLDGEPEFTDENNRCFGVEHICRNNLDFRKLASSHKGQVVNIDGTGYTVVGFTPRSVYAVQFVMHKIEEYPERVQQYVKTISTSDPKDMIEQIRALTDNTQEQKKLYDLYHFSNNDLGIPIESFIHEDYGRYIQALAYLLFTPDQAFYAGAPVIENGIDDIYVITISTLVLLAIEDWFYVLDPIKDRIVCPDSYLEFFKNLYEKEIETQAVSVGEIGFDENGNAIMTERSKLLVDILEKIVKACQEFKTVPITDDERINYEMLEGTTGERFAAGIHVDIVQVDAFIVAEKLNATYMCDDLFFRKLASYKNIKNVNFSSLLYHYTDLSFVKNIILGLSKTNYIYTPFLYETQEEAHELVQNLMTGKKKEQFYGEFFNIRFSYMRMLFSRMLDYDDKADA